MGKIRLCFLDTFRRDVEQEIKNFFLENAAILRQGNFESS